ncbi:MAG: hypothetical protein R3F30_07415 [Planctomycetota bacterium]
MQTSDLLIGGRHPLGYCTNVHPADDLAEAEAVLRDKAAPTLGGALGGGPKLLAAWWPAPVARVLAADAEARARLAELCADLQLVPMSLNAFPMGRFHGEDVKLQVYEPGWGDDARLTYTVDAAAAVAGIQARLGADRAVLSTVPLGFRGVDRERRPGEEQRRDLFRAAQALARIEDETGVHVEVALEPEPWCQLGPSARPCAGSTRSCSRARPGRGPRRPRGAPRICLDLCHAAVVGEDAVRAVHDIEAAGVRLGKVQLSVCPRARGAGRPRAPRPRRAGVAAPERSRAEAGPWMDLSDPRSRPIARVETRRSSPTSTGPCTTPATTPSARRGTSSCASWPSSRPAASAPGRRSRSRPTPTPRSPTSWRSSSRRCARAESVGSTYERFPASRGSSGPAVADPTPYN